MSLGTMEQRTEGIKRQAQELIEQAYHRGFKAGREDRQDWEKDQADRLIEKGRNEAWEAASKVIKMGEYIRKFEVFPECGDGEYPFDKVSASEAIERIHAYEEQKKQEEECIKVGDEVYLLDENYLSVVTCIYDAYDKKKAVCITQNGKWDVNTTDVLHRTGRHFPEIAEVLKKLQEGE